MPLFRRKKNIHTNPDIRVEAATPKIEQTKTLDAQIIDILEHPQTVIQDDPFTEEPKPPTAHKISYYMDDAGKWRWRLRLGNNKNFAVSGESFDSKPNARRAATRMASLIPTATVHEEPLKRPAPKTKPKPKPTDK